MQLALRIAALVALAAGVAHAPRVRRDAAKLLRVLPPASLRRAFVLVSYGEERCASTFQYYVLIRIAQLVRGAGQVETHYQRRFNDTVWNRLDPSLIHVVKTHRGPNLTHVDASRGALFLATRSKMWRESQGVAELPVIHVQQYYRFVRLGWEHELYTYAGLFGLADSELRALHANVRYWVILRQCCGLQASINQFSAMRGAAPVHGLEAFEYVDCQMYDLERVEELYRRTNLSEQCGSNIHVKYGVLPGELPRGYCMDSIKAMQKGRAPAYAVNKAPRDSLGTTIHLPSLVRVRPKPPPRAKPRRASVLPDADQ